MPKFISPDLEKRFNAAIDSDFPGYEVRMFTEKYFLFHAPYFITALRVMAGAVEGFHRNNTSPEALAFMQESWDRYKQEVADGKHDQHE